MEQEQEGTNRRKNMSDDWKEQKKRQKAIFTAQQNLPYEVKVKRAELRAREFIQELDRRGMNAHVLRERNEKEWEFWMYRCCTDPETGERFGWGRVLDYIGVRWEDKWEPEPEQLEFHFC